MLPDSPAMMIPLEAFDERLGDGPTHDKFVRVTGVRHRTELDSR